MHFAQFQLWIPFCSFSWALLRAHSCARLLRGFCFPGSSLNSFGSLPECSPSVWEQKPSLLGASRKRGKKGETQMYLNSVTVVGFLGADPEQRQRNSDGTKFTVLSVATQRSWKNAQDEWSSKTEWHRVCIFRPRLADYVLDSVKKGSHVLVEGSPASSTFENQPVKAKTLQPQRLPRGPFVPTPCGGSTAANRNPRRSLPPQRLRKKLPSLPERLRSERGAHRPRLSPGPFFCWPQLRPSHRKFTTLFRSG